MDSKKKKYIIIASICVVLLIVIGATYAYWTTTQVQKDENVINTDCLNITYANKEESKTGFTLEKAFPISDDDGRALEGYTFTITNTCNTYVNYTVNMESLKLTETGDVSTDDTDSDTKKVNINYINTTLNDGAVLELNGYKQIDTLLTEKDGSFKAYDTRELETGALGPSGSDNASIEYTLRMWLDSETPDTQMNKTYKGKISVWATPTKEENAVDKITKLAESTPAAASTDSTSQIVDDNTNDHNLRYIGANPDNYVDIGNGVYPTDIYHGYKDANSKYNFVEYTSAEACSKGIDVNGATKYNTECTLIHKKGDPILWRIIGVMNNVEGGTKESEKRIKIIREEGIGEIYWDYRCDGEIDETGSCTGSDDYYNNWQNASLNELLNNAYWNREITKIANRGRDALEKQPDDYYQYYDFSNIGIRKISRNLFEKAKWYLGGTNDAAYETETTDGYYEKERNASSNKYGNNPESVDAIVGLMYPSDYGYATSGGTNKDRTACLEKELYNWNNNNYTDCKTNDWLWDSEYWQWTISPYASNDTSAANVSYGGSVYPDDSVDYDSRVRPVLYLKSDVKIVSGDGTKENPYRIAA